MADVNSPMKDKHYNLVSVLQASLHYAWQMDTYISDAEAAGDSELAEWFKKIQHNNLKAGEQGKKMLMQRLSSEES
jgi:predicted amidophosphoribosyltransferase